MFLFFLLNSNVFAYRKQSISPYMFLLYNFLFLGVPGFALTFPVIVLIVGMVYGKLIAMTLFSLSIPLAFLPYKSSDSNCYSWLGLSCSKYFSYKAFFRRGTEFADFFKRGKPYILVAPPHG